MSQRRDNAMLRAIGVFKLVKATMLVVFGVLVLGRIHTGIGHDLRDLASELGLVGVDRRIADLVTRLGVLEASHNVAIGAAAIGYAGLFVVEGVGLLLRKLWGEYVASIITASFVPLEIYELVEKPTWIKAVVVALNIAIVVYLVLRLRRDGHWPFRHRRGTKTHAAGDAVGDVASS